MSWHFPFVLLVTVTLPSVCLQFNPQPLEELGSDIGIQVFSQIAKSRPQENIVVSPHGIASVLGMLQLGADGRTKAQLTAVMRYGVKGTCAVAGLWLQGLAGVLPASAGSLLGLLLKPQKQAEQPAGFPWRPPGLRPRPRSGTDVRLLAGRRAR